jgi:hypothetical protein
VLELLAPEFDFEILGLPDQKRVNRVSLLDLIMLIFTGFRPVSLFIGVMEAISRLVSVAGTSNIARSWRRLLIVGLQKFTHCTHEANVTHSCSWFVNTHSLGDCTMADLDENGKYQLLTIKVEYCS